MVPSSASTPSSGRAESTGPVPSPPDAVVLTVRKGARTLELRRGSLSQTFRIGLGFSPVGTKEREGDGKTPEGTYRVVYRNPGSRFHLSLALNYPNSVDAERGFAAGTITKAQRDAIVRADRRKGIPPWNSLLGGEIFIHGRGSGSDWTLGCIALDDRDMELLFDAVPPGSEVKILP
jgi:murein L,D-transpeptidase YafK